MRCEREPDNGRPVSQCRQGIVDYEVSAREVAGAGRSALTLSAAAPEFSGTGDMSETPQRKIADITFTLIGERSCGGSRSLEV